MKHSKRSSEGYLMINHKDSPGLTDEFLGKIQQACPGEDTLPPGSGHGMFETSTVSCSHCQAMVILNPLRNRQRGWCGRCGHYVCDRCAGLLKIGVPCKPFAQIIEEVLEAAIQGKPTPQPFPVELISPKE